MLRGTTDTKVMVLIDLKVDLCNNWSTKGVSTQKVITSVVDAVPVSCFQCELSRPPRLVIVE